MAERKINNLGDNQNDLSFVEQQMVFEFKEPIWSNDDEKSVSQFNLFKGIFK